MGTGGQGGIVGVHDAERRCSQLLRRVENGEEVTIARHGTAVARLVPVRPSTTPEDLKAAILRWREWSRHIKLGGLKVRNLISEECP